MPPEASPCWDRKDVFRERKHERSSDSFNSANRWRDSSSSSSSYHHHHHHHHHGSRDFARWGGSSSDFRRPPPGHGKQGGWHMYPEEMVHGYAPSRSSERMIDEDSYRPSLRNGDGKYGRGSRDNRGSYYSQKDWKSHPWEASNGSPSPAAGRHFVMGNEQRLNGDIMRYNSHPPHNGAVNGWEQGHFKEQPDKFVGANDLGPSHRYERENSLGSNHLKRLKWSRAGSLTSRGSGYSHSSSSKSAGADYSEAKAELQPRRATPTQSASGDAAACATSTAPYEETSPRKKPRLGWGEGLAKFEKKVVDPDEGPNANGDSSPRVIGYSDCASPTTPSSIACSSSPGMENRAYATGPNTENETSNLIGAPGIGFLNHLEVLSVNLKNLDANSIATIGSSLIEFLQTDELAASDSKFMRFTAPNNLLKWKGDISKVLEMTESEIDSLENELNSLAQSGSLGSYSAVPNSMAVEGIPPLIGEKGIVSNLIHRPTRLRLGASKDMIASMSQLDSGAELHARDEAKDEEIDSPGTATSKLIEPSTSPKEAPSSNIVKRLECPWRTSISTDAAHNNNMVSADVFACENNKLIDGGASTSASASVNLCMDVDSVSLCDLILSSNKESASRAYKVLNKLLPVGEFQSGNQEATNISSWKNDSCITENFARRKRFLRFKERVITLKYRAFQHLWKEDLRLLSMRKNRAKSLKRFELSARVSNVGFQKHRSPLLSRFDSPGNSSLVPTTEMINFTSKLLLDSQVKLCRDTLKMPALILDNKDKLASRFLSSNGLVEDPHAIEKERTMINPWTSEEKKFFMDNLATFGKDFTKIASFLDHKTTADCVEFYYKNHKSESFEKKKKHPETTKQGKLFSANNYLLTSGKKWNRDMNAASLHILGAASVIAAHADVGLKPFESDLETSNTFFMSGKARETAAAADVLAGICGSLSSEAMGSCITSSVDPGEGYHDWKSKKVVSSRKRPLTPEVTQSIDDEETCSDDSCGEIDPSDWTDEEKSIFVQAIASYGRDFGRISRRVRTRSADQCKIFFSKARKCLGLDMLHPGSVNNGTSFSDDCNEGGSGTEDACIVEAGSNVLPLSVVKRSHDESVLEVANSLRTNIDRSEENTGTVEAEHTVPEMVDNSVVDECQLDAKLGQLISNGEKNMVEDVEGKSLLMHDQNGAVISTGSEVRSDQPGIVGLSSGETKSDSIVDLKYVVEEPVHGVKAEGEGRDVQLSENCDGKEDISNVETVDQQILACSVVDMDVNQNVPLVAADKTPVKLDVSTNFQHHSLMELDSNRNSLLTEVYVSKDSDVQSDETPSQNLSSSNYGREVNRSNQYKKLKCVDDQYQHLRVHPISNHVESSQILRGYPLHLSTKKEMNGNINGRTSVVPVQRFIAQEYYLQKCNSSNPHSSVSGLHLLAQNSEEQNHHRPKSSHLRSSSDPENHFKGDFKLFGKILSHNQPSSEKENSFTQDKDKPSQHPKLSCNSLNLKFSSHQNIDAVSKIDGSNYLGNENFVSRTYGFWDGNRIQTGFSAVPDAILRAKYPASFNYPSSSSSKLDLQSVVVKSSNESNLNGLTVFPTMESSRNGVTDFQMFRSCDDNKLQTLKQNGFDGFSSVQHQGRGIVGMNVLGRAGILVGGLCPPPAVSDPVAAIQMHYAKKAEQYGGSIIVDEEAWRGKGDVGR